jgi:phenylacetate-CoA ligase
MFDHVVFSHQPLRLLKGLASAYLAYPAAERIEHRDVRSKLRELRSFYRRSFSERLAISRARLADALGFAGSFVPYYRDLFREHGFDPERVRDDVRHIEDLPYLTKDVIREQGERLLSRPLADGPAHACKTGGSTGLSCVIHYDQVGADFAAAITLYGRERVGATKFQPEVHFACRFPDMQPQRWPTREDFKCFAMNRSNIFFDRIDDEGLEAIWQQLRRQRPYLAHAHPSTFYALAGYIERRYGGGKAFEVFESSGELLEPYMRETIERVLQCRVVDRYGLAELGVVGYETDGTEAGLRVFESEVWPEHRPAAGHEDAAELVFTGFRNRLMPLIRYATGDLGRVARDDNGFVLKDVVGRIHDIVPINGVEHATHHIQDMLDHRVGGIQEFQIDLREQLPVLRIVPEPGASVESIGQRIEAFWPGAFRVAFVGHDDFVRVGSRAKFRHVVTA